MVVQVFTTADTDLRSLLLLLLHVIARFFNAAKTPLTLRVLFSPRNRRNRLNQALKDLYRVRLASFRGEIHSKDRVGVGHA